METFSELAAISPIDGRYRNKIKELSSFFSEYALIRYRVLVEVEYFIALCEWGIEQLKGIDKIFFPELRKIYENFTEDDAARVKKIETITNHDVKAVEYFLREEFERIGLSNYLEFIHFGLTSQDINNTAVPLSYKHALEKEYYPLFQELVTKLEILCDEWKDIPMLAHTHGQPASPTRLGKEFKVFINRLAGQLTQLKQVPFSAKFGGATGNFNAHLIAYPEIDWISFGNAFVHDKLGLIRSEITTQIEPYDNFAASCDAMKRINTILIDLCRDTWTYISMEYFKQKILKGEVGSSAMPHKVNPIDFENAEGNLGIANAILEHFSAKLPISRMQRDLTDSTVLRNIGVPVGHTLIGIHSILKGLGKLYANLDALEKDLEKNWAVVAEAIQTILRRESYPNPFEALKELTRTGEKINQESIRKFIDNLDLPDSVRNELKNITPHNYLGIRL